MVKYNKIILEDRVAAMDFYFLLPAEDGIVSNRKATSFNKKWQERIPAISYPVKPVIIFLITFNAA